MSTTEKRIVFSFRARLVVVMTVVLLATLGMVQLLNDQAQSDVQDALEQQKETVNETVSAHTTEIAQATNFALNSLRSQEYMDDILAKPEYKDKFDRDRIRHILVVEDDGTIKDSSEKALRNKVIETPGDQGDDSLGVVQKGDPVASLGEDAAGLLEQAPDPGPTPEDDAARRSDVDRVRAAIEAIPEPFREAVVLRDLEDLSYAEIAEVTGVPVGTVMSRLSRGRTMLAKELLPAAKPEADQSRSAK